MRIQLENIGKIHQAQIDLNGITAIAEEIIRVKYSWQSFILHF